MLLTLPLVPVFMWLIGSYTADMTRERWQALRQLSSHFLDVVRGLPTLRSFGRGTDEVAVVGEVSERYRKTTMETLRISFLSGSVLELAATIGVALVAVTAGVRLVGGSLGLQAGLTVIILAPELYLPYPPARRRVPRERGRAGGGRADVRAARCPGGGRRRRSAARAEPRDRAGAPRASLVLVPVPSRYRCSTGSTSSCRPARSWRSSARAAPARARWRRCCSGCCRRPAAGSRSATSTCPSAGSTRGGGSSPGCPSIRRCSGRALPTTSASATPRRRRRRSAQPRCSPALTSSSAALPDGYDTAGRRRGAVPVARASAAGSDSRGRSSGTRRW